SDFGCVTIELPVGNNVVPLLSDTIQLVQDGCSFHGLRSEDPNQHLKDLLKLVDSLDLDKEAWATIEKLAQNEDEGWDNSINPEEGSLNHENPDIEQLLGVIEYKVDALMKDAISLIGRSEGVFRMTSNEIYQLPPEPSRQEEFEHIVMNFILDQEERIKKLEEYMKVIVGDFMQLSLEVTKRLKEKIREEGRRMRKIKKIIKYPNMEAPKPLAGHKFPETPEKKNSPIPSNLPPRTHYG
ncbi:hypothetical protein Tco_0896213, partial [Tanacetum coccineum]